MGGAEMDCYFREPKGCCVEQEVDGSWFSGEVAGAGLD
jgi:hypothetical protein